MSTTVLLEVTPHEPPGDLNHADPPLPADLAAALRVEGVKLTHGWSRRGDRPWRMRWHLSGPDRVAIGLRLEADLRRLGYEADVSFWRG